MKRLIAILLLVSSAVLAEPFSHDGLFANAAMGLGYASFENANKRASLTADGLGVKLHGKLGYYFVRNLALHANLGYVMYSNFREAENGLPVYVDHDFYVVSSVFVGAGATYYVPGWSNVFLSGSLGVTGYSLNCHKYSGNTGLRSFTMGGEIGKEWWMSERLGLGVSLSFNSGEYWSDDDGVFRSSYVMLLFSVSLH
ncbi:MAG: hypothetical protein J5925_04625 [Clostridia bacterium]|nr:hypothetical protein [Clostridia bacterium]